MGQLAAYFGISSVFFVTCALLLLNAVLVYTKVYKKLNNPKVQTEEMIKSA